MKIILKFGLICLLIIIFTFNISIAHKDFFITKNYKNVIVRVLTGFCYEEINKAMIIGKLSEDLCNKLNYSDTVLLDFIHNYTGKEDPQYFISFEDGCLRYYYQQSDNIDFVESDINKDVIIIRQISNVFDPINTLKLLEYGLKNTKYIDSNQKQIKLKPPEQMFLYTIDKNMLDSIITLKPSEEIKNILEHKVRRQHFDSYCCSVGEYDDSHIYYYYQNNQFYINFNYSWKNIDSICLILPNIYDFRNLTYEYSLVFDSDSTFYFLENWNNHRVSLKQTIKSEYSPKDYVWFNSYQPHEIYYLGGNKVSIYYGYGWKVKGFKSNIHERHLLYYIDKDTLIQDIDFELKINPYMK